MKVLWASPFNLHDTSSGAAIEVRCLLEQLVTRGVSVAALAAFIFDAPSGASQFPNLKAELEASPNQLFFNVEQSGIRYEYMRTKSTHVSDITDGEQRQFFSRYCHTLCEFRPDLVIMYGGGLLEMGLRAEARRRGIPVVYSLCNGNHSGYSFPDVDLIITASKATSALYAKRDSMLVMPTGPFIRPSRVVAENRDPKYVTFVNPVPEKGVGLMARLFLMAKEQMPDQRFLVVQSRGNWHGVVPALKMDGEPIDISQYTNVDVANHTTDMRPVYGVTKVLLAPSLWYEAYGMVATEACMNGIPVIASTSGGLPEAVGEGGIILETPEACRKDYSVVPSAEEMQPWLDALKGMLQDAASLTSWSEKALKAAENHSLEHSTDRVMELFAPLFARKAGNNPQLFRAGSSVTR